MIRETTRALKLVLAAHEHLDAANRKLVEAAHVLRNLSRDVGRGPPRRKKGT